MSPIPPMPPIPPPPDIAGAFFSGLSATIASVVTSGGRQRGTPNKTTQEVLAAASAKMEVLGKPVIVKTALELVQSVYRDPDLPLQVRLHAAIIAIAREAPPSSGVSDMSLEERRRRVEELMDRHRISWVGVVRRRRPDTPVPSLDRRRCLTS
jgi:hypothetical protein